MQIGITMASIGIGALGEPALASILKGALGHTLSHGVAAAVLVIVAFVIIASCSARCRARWFPSYAHLEIELFLLTPDRTSDECAPVVPEPDAE